MKAERAPLNQDRSLAEMLVGSISVPVAARQRRQVLFDRASPWRQPL